MDESTIDKRNEKALAAVAGQFFAKGAMTASFIARAPQIRDRVGVTVDEYGLMLMLAAVFGLAGSLLAGRILHMVTTRTVLQLGAVITISTLPVIGGARQAWVLLVGLSVFMFVEVLVDIAMNLQGSWISSRRHTPVMNRLHGSWSLGALTGGLGAFVANAAGLSTFAHLTSIAAVMALAMLFVTRNVLASDVEGHGFVGIETPVHGVPVRSPVVLLVLAGMFAVVMEGTVRDWAAFRLSDDFDVAAALGSAAFVAYTAGMTGMRLGGDWLQARLGKIGLHRLSVAFAAAGLVLASFVPNEIISIAGFLLAGVGVATLMPKLYDDAARLPGRHGSGLGAMTAAMRVAFIVTPLAVGGLAGTSLSVGDAIAVLTLPAVIGLTVVTEWNERLGRPPIQRVQSPNAGYGGGQVRTDIDFVASRHTVGATTQRPPKSGSS